ncbi:hypothetical protein GCM10027615_68860 [Plantactinospora veratri]
MVEQEADTIAGTAVVDAERDRRAAAGLSSADSVLLRVRSRLTEFTGALRRVAEHVLSDPSAAARATIVELAERSGTSPATVTRFCRALGFEGYADLRLGIAAETGRAHTAGWTVDIGREIQPNDPLERVLGQIIAADTQAMHDTAALLDLAEVERAAEAIAGAARVNIFGASGSALVGEEMQFSLHRIGVAAWAWNDVHEGLAGAALLRKGDVALGISHTGVTRETIETLAEAGSHGATTVALTGFPGPRWPNWPTSCCSPPARRPPSGRTRSPPGTRNSSCSTCSTSPSPSAPTTGPTPPSSGPPGRWADTRRPRRRGRDPHPTPTRRAGVAAGHPGPIAPAGASNRTAGRSRSTGVVRLARPDSQLRR